MITTLAMLVTLAASPCSDPWDATSVPFEQWASYWTKPTPAPMPPKTAPVEFVEFDNIPNTGRLTIDQFVRQNQLSVLTDNIVSAADAYQVVGSYDGKRIVLSTLWCQATHFLGNKHINRLDRMRWKTQQERAQLQLSVFEIQPLTCDSTPVLQLLDCLGPPKLECMTNRDLSAEVRAAKQLAP